MDRKVKLFNREIRGKIIKGEGGEGVVSYGLVIMLIAIASVGSFTLFGNSVVELFNKIVISFP